LLGGSVVATDLARADNMPTVVRSLLPSTSSYTVLAAARSDIDTTTWLRDAATVARSRVVSAGRGPYRISEPSTDAQELR